MTLAATAQPIAQDASTARPHPAPPCRAAIGPVVVEIDGDGGGSTADFAHLYAGQRVDHLPPDRQHIRMEVRPASSARWPAWRRRFNVLGDGEELFSDLSAGEVLPYLEWGVNYRLIAANHAFLKLHAATLAYKGRGVMLVGESGSGKSTLTAILAARGWDYFSDEFALIHPQTLQLHSFPKALCVKSGSFRLVQDLGLPLWRRRCWVKAFKGPVGYVRPADLRVATHPAPIRLIVFPRFTGGSEPRVYPISRSQAVFSVAANAFNRQDFGPSLVDLLGRVAAGADCLVVEPGTPAATAAALEARLTALSA